MPGSAADPRRRRQLRRTHEDRRRRAAPDLTSGPGPKKDAAHVPDDEPFPRPKEEDAFEAMWKTRDSHLKSVPGFVSFHLMRGEVDGDARFMPPTRSGPTGTPFSPGRNPRRSAPPTRARNPRTTMYDGPPVLECFDSVQAIEAD
jgi:hypothetical protein